MNSHDLRLMLDAAAPSVTNTVWQQKFRELVMTPTNPNMLKCASDLLKKLYTWQGKKTISGQHEYLEAPYSKERDILRITGELPGLKGVEFGGITGQSASLLNSQRQNVTNACIAWHKDGGIVAATYHAAYPGAGQLWDQVKRWTSQEQFDEILTAGTELNNALLRDIDSVAVHLKQLRDAGVPVLWRPYHEMNGGWFWWGNKNNFAELWALMMDRYTNYHYLDNLIWVWSPNAKNTWCGDLINYYPGSENVDILAADIYENDFKRSHYDDLMRIGAGKLIAIGENGQIPTAELLAVQNNYSYHLTWGNLLLEKNTELAIKSFYSSPNILNQVDLKDPTVGDGLKGQYYSGTNFEVQKEVRIDPTVNFMWNLSSPFPKSIPVDKLSVRWTGYVRPQFTEEYTFYAKTDDGCRLWVNDVLLVDRWMNQSFQEWNGKIKLEADKRYSIKMEFFDNAGDARAIMSWSSPSQPKQVVPTNRLFSS